MRRIRILASAVVPALLVSLAIADEIVVYPKEEQTPEQREKDEFECYRWAVEQSKFDPMDTPSSDVGRESEDSSPQRATQGGAVRGAVRGAVVGGAAGAVVGDAGKGAAAGAAAGAVGGSLEKRDARREQEAAESDAKDAREAALAEARRVYDRAYRACLEGRGYTVE